MDSTTDTSASQLSRVGDMLDPLTEKILKHENVVATLQELRRLAKGNGTLLFFRHSPFLFLSSLSPCERLCSL